MELFGELESYLEEEASIVNLKESLNNINEPFSGDDFITVTPEGCRILVYNKIDGENEHLKVTEKDSIFPFLSSWASMNVKIFKQRLYWPNHIEDFSDSSSSSSNSGENEDCVSENRRFSSSQRREESIKALHKPQCGPTISIHLDDEDLLFSEVNLDGSVDEPSSQYNITGCLKYGGNIFNGCSGESDENSPNTNGCLSFLYLDHVSHFARECWYVIFQYIFNNTRRNREILKKEHCELMLHKISKDCQDYKNELLCLQNHILVEMEKLTEKQAIYNRMAFEKLINEGDVSKALVFKRKSKTCHEMSLGCDRLKTSLIELQYSLTTFQSVLKMYTSSVRCYFVDCKNTRYSVLKNIKNGRRYFKHSLKEIKTSCQDFINQSIYTNCEDVKNNEDNTSAPEVDQVSGNGFERLDHRKVILESMVKHYQKHDRFEDIEEILNNWYSDGK